MLIGKDWKIEFGDEGYTLLKKHKNKGKGEDYWSPEYYTLTLPAALNILLEQKIRRSDLKDLSTIVKLIEKTKKEIMEALDGQP